MFGGSVGKCSVGRWLSSKWPVGRWSVVLIKPFHMRGRHEIDR